MGIQTAVRARDLADLPRPDPAQGKHYELSEGQLIIVGNAKAAHERVKTRVARILYRWTDHNPGVEVFVEYQFDLKEDTARIPDIALVRNEKLAAAGDSDVYAFAPDTAIEILSPSETPSAAEKKVDEYLAAGAIEVWQIFAELKKVHVRTLTGTRELKGDDLLDTPVLPGFQIPVSAIFA
jgi:Uma2 family endonuclease